MYRTIDAAVFHALALSRNLSSRSRHEHSLLVIPAGSGWERALWYRHAKMASYERGDGRKRDPTSTIAPSHLNIREGRVPAGSSGHRFSIFSKVVIEVLSWTGGGRPVGQLG